MEGGCYRGKWGCACKNEIGGEKPKRYGFFFGGFEERDIREPGKRPSEACVAHR